MKNKQTLSAVVGNIMEFYDFIIYAYLAKYISTNFFNTKDEITTLLITFSVFASGYLTRPIGSILFGYIGDTIGRKKALIISISIITAATFCIGLLPSYSQIGIAAPLLLVVLRLTQGLAVSGEEGGAAVYLSEANNFNGAGILGSLILGSAYFGVLIGACVCLGVTTYLTDTQMYDFGWRLPFIFSLILGAIAIKYRLQGIETLHLHEKKPHTKLSAILQETFVDNIRQIITLTLLVSSLAIPIYLYTVFLPNYIMKVLAISVQESLRYSVLSLLALCFFVPASGWLSEKVSYEKMFRYGCIASVILGYPIFIVMTSGNIVLLIISQCLMGGIISFIAAPLFALLISRFPTNIRYTGVSFVFNTAMALFGSTAPIVAFSIMQFGDIASPGIYWSLAAIIGLLTIKILKAPEPKIEYAASFN